MAQELPVLPAGIPFGTWLRQRRKALDLTQEQLAARAAVSLSTIVKVEAGQRRPSREVAEVLACCLDVPPEQHAVFVRLARAPLAAAPAADCAGARAFLKASLALREQAGDEQGIAFCLAALADLACTEHSFSEARALYALSLALYRGLGDEAGLAADLEGLALAYLGLARPALAVHLWSAAYCLRHANGSSPPLDGRARQDEALALARSRLGEAAFDQAWDAGAVLPLPQAITYALDPPAG